MGWLFNFLEKRGHMDHHGALYRHHRDHSIISQNIAWDMVQDQMEFNTLKTEAWRPRRN